MHELRINKGNGKFRSVVAVGKEERYFYRELLENQLEQTLTGHLKENGLFNVVHGRKYSNTVANAIPHQRYQYTLSVDLKSCFDSMTRDVAAKNGFPDLPEDCFVAISTSSEPVAAQGLPTSTVICNLLLVKTDIKILHLLHKTFKGEFAYTRYIDDLTISFNSFNEKKYTTLLSNLVYLVSQSGFEVNMSKVELQRALDGRRRVCGLAVDEGGVYLPRKLKRTIRALEHKESMNLFPSKQTRTLRGLLAYGELKLPNKLGAQQEDTESLIKSIVVSGEWGKKWLCYLIELSSKQSKNPGQEIFCFRVPHTLDDGSIRQLVEAYTIQESSIENDRKTLDINQVSSTEQPDIRTLSSYDIIATHHEVEVLGCTDAQSSKLKQAYFEKRVNFTSQDRKILGFLERREPIPRSLREVITIPPNTKKLDALVCAITGLFDSETILNICKREIWLSGALENVLNDEDRLLFLSQHPYAYRYMLHFVNERDLVKVLESNFYSAKHIFPHIKTAQMKRALGNTRELYRKLVSTNSYGAMYLVPPEWFKKERFISLCSEYFNLTSVMLYEVYSRSVAFYYLRERLYDSNFECASLDDVIRQCKAHTFRVVESEFPAAKNLDQNEICTVELRVNKLVTEIQSRWPWKFVIKNMG
ncbi:TPA: hypothetical protein K4M41_000743 [Vibrio parahaemolyticus]|nr:hypothetical protein [Vibrio parahaemolyticus]